MVEGMRQFKITMQTRHSIPTRNNVGVVKDQQKTSQMIFELDRQICSPYCQLQDAPIDTSIRAILGELHVS
jgi:hypothetical protein